MGLAASSSTKVGYQVLSVQQNSPAHLAGLVPFFDFIVGSPLTEKSFSREGPELIDLLRRNVGKEVPLSVYNSRAESLRDVVVVPGETGVGLSVRFASYESASELVWHVLDVSPDSPAARAGLVRGEFIIGSPDVLFCDPEDIFTLVHSSIGSEVPLFVFDAESNTLRTVKITPGPWLGGRGVLGCDLGTGILHRIPSSETITPITTVVAASQPPAAQQQQQSEQKQ